MRTPRIAPAVALVLLALAGCTLAEPGAAAPTKTAQPYAIDQGEVIDRLGTAPPWTPPTPERIDAILDHFLDQQWSTVVSQYPEAVRPDVVEVERAEGANDKFTTCIAGSSGAGLEGRTLLYSCSAQYPTVPPNVLTLDQAAYLYDYWTGFVMPCYVENGSVVESAPPARDDFVANWPYQNWWPAPEVGDGTASSTERARLEELCPASLDVF